MTYRNRYILRLTILLSVLLAGSSAMAQESSSSTGSGVVVHGSVYGGGNLADVKTNTEVNICAKKQTSGETVTYVAVSAGNGVTIEGNVYGGGKGVAKMVPGEIGAGDAFECKKAMVGIDNDGLDTDGKPKTGGTTVRIFNGTVGTLEGTAGNQTLKEGTGNVYGGGQVGRVERNTIVTIGAQGDEDNSEPIILGNVFGAGRGEKTHGYSALVRGNSDVTVQGSATVGKSVYGGGQIATVGRYTVVDGLPTETTSGGICTVTIRDNATIKENVFGAGKGTLPYEDCVTGDKPQHMNGAKHLVDGVWDGTWDDVLVEYPEYDPEDYDQNKPEYANYIKFIKSLALVSDTEVTIDGESKVNGSVYGGSESGFVQQDTQVKILGSCTIGTTSANSNIFGGGLGSDDFAEAGVVRRNTEVYINGGTTNGTVYGGGSLGNVKGTTEVNIYANKVNDEYVVVAKEDDDVTITGNVYGGGKGHEDTFTCEKAMVGVDGDGIEHSDGGTTVRIFNGKVNGSVYGGGQVGRVEKNTVVTIGSGDGGNDASKPYIGGDVFGAGAGVKTHGFSALVRGNSTVTVEGDAQIGESVYGGGQIATVGRYIVINSLPTKPAGGGLCTVHIQGHAIIGQESEGDVFGAGKGIMPYEGVSSGNPWSMQSGNTIKTYSQAEKDLYFSFIQTLGLAGDTEVTIGANASVKGSVYGGSESGFVQRYTQVTIQGSCEIGTTVGTGDDAKDQHGDIYGGGRGDDSVEGYAHAGKVKGNTTVNINGGTMHGSVYGGGEMGYTVGRADVNMAGGTVNHDVYGGGALADTNVGNGDDENGYVEVPELTAGSSSVVGYYENTYVDTDDNTAVANKTYFYGDDHAPVTVLAVGTSLEDLETDLYNESGTETEEETALENKVYYTQSGVPTIITVGTSTTIGGTILSEWSESDYVTSSGTAVDGKKYYTITHPTTVNLTAGTIKGDAYGGGLGQLGTEVVGVKYTQSEADAYNEANNLNEGDDGYKTTEDWKTQPVAAADGTGSVKATVYGDINVNLGSASGSTATAFYITNYDGDHSGVVKSGRVFGCNNLNGSPQGNVTVDVFKTVKGNSERTDEDAYKKKVGETGYVAPTYEVAAVYGGGNLADFTTSGKKASVIIETCDVSVQSVYGGGNAAAVPETDVLVKAAYEIGEVFGGGNGKDSYTTNGGTSWTPNPGANVNGPATTLLKGGYIHEAYGGSNSKGTISGKTTINKGSGGSEATDCALQVDELYGAGKDADIEGDLIVILGCSETRTEAVYGCSMNANVKGNVELTITSGEYGKVFGGNNLSGSIFGHIIVNIEEIGCSPIIIDELYLGGNDAAYSVYGYYQAKRYEKTESGVTKLFLDAGMTIPLYKDDETGFLYRDAGKTKRIYEDDSTPNHLLYVNEEKTKPLYMPRTSADDQNAAVTFAEHPHTVLDENKTHYDNPELNIISCTSIGQVFGGGLGTGATIYGNPKVNINMIQGAFHGQSPAKDNPNELGAIGTVYGGGNAADIVGSTTVNIGTEPSVDKIVWSSTNDEPVYESDGITPSTTSVTVLGAYISGNVFGGGKGKDDSFFCEKAMVGTDGAGVNADFTDNTNYTDGNTNVTIAKGTVGTLDAQGKLVEGTGNVYGGGEIGRVEKNTNVTIGVGDANAAAPTSAPIIRGDVFGGGKGKKTHGYAALVRGNPTVIIQADAKVGHSVYGAGEIASVARYRVPRTPAEVAQAIADGYTDAKAGMPIALVNNTCGYCTVTVKGNAEIGPDNMKMYHATNNVIPDDDKPDDAGHVFAAGKGFLPENYTYADKAHKPKRMMLYNADYYDDDNEDDWDFIKEYTTAEINDNSINKYVWEYFPDREAYITFIQTQALASNTEVSIEGNAFVKGSVYGGSENGLVQYNTKVYIKGGQIGCGKNTTNRHDPEVWDDDFELPANVNLECASWDYGRDTDNDGIKDQFAPYDPYAIYENTADHKYYYNNSHTESAEGGAKIATDGHTYYGNVFGGGSGSVPYFDTDLGRSVYLHSAGTVKGNTEVVISGGHILTNVYGGCEATNVNGKATITMTGGTIGVPRTLQQIVDHPVTCYLFGAGKGDQRIFFNKDTNVEDVEITISGGTIYGSVYGGGEDGHVMHDVQMTIEDKTTTTGEGEGATTTTTSPKIGTFGTSYFDGNVFGGGRGFGGDAYTAGNIAGSIKMEIKGGTMLGSVYGGGRLGSVGYGLYESTETETATTHKMYGEMQDDGYGDWYKNTSNVYVRDEKSSFKRGHVEIEISGGTIGNDAEFKYYTSSLDPSDYATQEALNTARATELEGLKAADGIDYTEFEYNESKGYYILTHTKGGNVFAGGMGRFKQQDGTSYIKDIDWWKLGCVKSTKLTIKGGTIKSNVYGGGELGQVVGHHDIKDSEGHTVYTDEEQTTAKVTSTEITIQGSSTTIGTEVKDDSNNTQYTFGSVFGGGYGSLLEVIPGKNQGDEPSYPKFIAGLVEEDTKIDMQNGAVKASIYGGGEMASVNGSTDVAVSNGTIGIAPITVSNNKRYFGGAKMGNVYGGGSGHYNTVRSGRILKNTNVTISDGTIYHNVYGGGAYGTVGDFSYTTGNDGKVNGVNGLTTTGTGTGVATVTITGGTIGYDGKENGMVFGSSRGDINAPGQRDDHTAWVYDTQVSIGTAATPATGTEGEEGYVAATSESGPEIKGTVYGSGENGHVFNDAVVTINGGTIGIAEGSPITTDDNGTPNDISDDTILSGAAYPYRGNVYGGGCGTDKYYSGTVPAGHTANDGEGNSFNPLAGIVYGTTTVNINGGTVVRNVYGAGAMGSVGRTVITTNTDNTTTTTYSGGSTTINVSGGTIGVSGTVGDGNVFGAARGDLSATGDYISQVRQTSVTVSGGTVKGNVYGGGELGDVGTIDKSDQTNYNYNWKDKNGNANNHGNNTILGTNNNTGICTVTVSGGTIGTDATAMNADGTFDNGNVFGGGKGSSTTWWCEKAIAYATNVTITAGTVRGSVYGGGEVGRVEDDAKVTIGLAENDAPTINGSVFGAGKGLMTHGYSALVRGNATVTVQGKSEVVGCVYGGGEIASVGKFHVDNGLPVKPMNGGTCTVIIQDEAKIGSNGTGHNVFGACKGVKSAYNLTNYKNFKSMQLFANRGTGAEKDTWDYYETYPNGYTGHIFVWKYYKTEEDYLAFLKTLALTSNTHVTIDEDATIYGSVFGGGERGVTLGGVDVNITGGTVNQDVYGGGSLADTNTAMWDAENNQRMTYVELPELIAGTSATGYYTSESADALITDANATVQADKTYYAIYKTNVNLKGGTVKGSAYGGGLGQLAKAAVAEQAAVLYADVDEYNTAKGTELSAAEFAALTEAEKTKTPAIEAQDAMSAVEAKVYGDVLVTLNGIKSTETTGTGESATTTNTYYDCEVQDKIFGCNNLNGSPQSAVTVHVYNTVKKNDSGTVTAKPAKESGTYELEAVYGGGNLAAYKPDFEAVADTAKAYVIIDGCDLTSIKQVYGGGNAASSPAANVTVNGTYEIREVFGGGNGADAYQIDGKTYENPGANVGYDSYAYHTWNASQNKYLVSEYGPGDGDDKDASTKEKRLANYQYGSGETHVSIYGGTVHAVYGGSNSKGNVRVASVALLDDEMLQTCEFDVDEAYGGGKNADMDGTATLIMSCIQGMKEVYGGAENADVLNNVTLNITNGTFDQVFGGNNVGGRITGSITVNIEETGCKPVIIGELYGGGNMAGYSIYGYKEVNGKWVPRTSNTDEGTGPASPYSDPQINVKSFTGIGNIFGGGFGETAVMVASPTVNIDVVKGRFSNQTSHERFTNKQWTLDSANKRYSKTIGGATVYVPAHEVNTIGGIYNVFGGGNAAKVIGTPHVKVGTQDYVEITTNLSDVRGYCTRTGGAGTQANPYTYSEPITGENAVTPTANTSYYKKVEGVDIRGNIYGGGNNAEVQGDTDVIIGKAAPTTP